MFLILTLKTRNAVDSFASEKSFGSSGRHGVERRVLEDSVDGGILSEGVLGVSPVHVAHDVVDEILIEENGRVLLLQESLLRNFGVSQRKLQFLL